jgi:hypothetical protein
MMEKIDLSDPTKRENGDSSLPERADRTSTILLDCMIRGYSGFKKLPNSRQESLLDS